ncbi:MAG: Ig-like domain-containing protein [Anaerolineae bacterium]|nr:Ig-like domain-containing protein [Anaerolineae bacterium]
MNIKHVIPIMLSLVMLAGCDGKPELDAPPRIAYVSPSPEEELALDGTIRVHFDQPMKQDSVKVSISANIKTELDWIDEATLDIMPSGLSRAYPYTISVIGQSKAGLKLEETPTEFKVNTVGLLRVAEIIPASHASDVALDSTITVFFNRPVVPLTVLDEIDTLPHPLHFEPDILGEGEWVNTSIYTWRPDGNLMGGQTYTATLDALSSADGAEMIEPTIWEFTTVPPQIVHVTPSDGSEGRKPDQPISIRFNQPMDKASIADSFKLVEISEQDGKQERPGRFEWNKENTEFTFTPQQPLLLETTYTASLSSRAKAAGGGIAIAEDYQWTFKTVLYPRIKATLPVDGEVNVSPLIPGIKIGVTAPLDQETLKDRMRISPQPPGEVSTFICNGDHSDITLRAILDDNTEYTVTLLPGVSDPYGNTLDETVTFTFTTGEYPPQFSLSPKKWLSIFDYRQTTDLLAFVRNIDKMNYRLYRIPETTLPDLSYGHNLIDYQPRRSWLYRAWSVDTGEITENTGYNWRIPLSGTKDRPIEPGVYIFNARADEIKDVTTRLIILANANIVTKHSRTEAMAWVTDMHSGEPLANVKVTFYYEGTIKIGEAITGRDGTASLTYADRGYTQLKEIVAVAQGDDVYGITYSQWGVEAYQYVYRYYDPYAIFPYTDRPLYRPGHEVFFKTIVRERDDEVYRLPGEQEVLVSVTNPQNDEIFRDTYPVSESGSIDGSFVLDPEAATGRYYLKTIVHWGEEQSSENIVWFHVAEYRRPDFQSSLTPNRAEVTENESVAINLDAHYFFGGAVQTGTVTWNVFSQPYYFRPDLPGRGYSFIDYDRNVPISTDYIAGYGQQIAEGSGSINTDGTFSFEVPSELAEFSSSQRFTIEAMVNDKSGQFVTASTEVVIHKGDAYAGVRPERYLNQVGEPAGISLVAVSRTGDVLPEQTIQVDVIQIKHYSVKEISPNGQTHWNNTTEEINVLKRDVMTNKDGIGTLAFTPLEAGSYKIIVSTTDRQGRSQRSSAYLWAAGGNQFVSWGQPNSNAINLVTDQSEYRPGDIAEILIPVPYAGNNIRALVTVERNNVLQHEVVDIDTNSFVYKLPIKQEYAPNIYFSVMLLKGADELNPLSDFRIGSVRLDVDTSSYELDISVTANVPDASPGDKVTYRVETYNANGEPVQAEVSFALVDLATLKLSSPNTGSLMDYFYRNIPIGVWSSLSLVHLEEPIPDELFDQAKGGGGGAGDSFYDLRRDFKDTAYWNATVQTGEDGIAEVTVTLPDNLTTWHMDVKAITPEGKVGQATHELMSTEKLLIRPVTPRFFIVGDQVTLAALAYNNTKRPLDAVVWMVGSGYTLNEGSDEVDVTIPAGGVVRVEWPVTIADDAEWVDLAFAVDAGELVDATKPPIGDPAHDQMLPVYRYNVSETVGTAGQLTGAGTRTETIFLPPTLNIEEATLDVKLDYSLAGSMTEALAWLENYPHLCTEQIVSRFLANAHTLQILRRFDLANPELADSLDVQIGQALQRLYAQQHADGGWGWFVSSPSSDLITAYVVHGLVTAKEAGYDIEQTALDRAVKYLSKPHDLTDVRVERNRQAYNLYVTARAGKPDPGRVTTLYDARSELDVWAKALLAQTIWLINPRDQRLDTLQSDLANNATISAGGAHWSEDKPDLWNWATNTRTTAIVLDTFVLLWPKHELNPNAVRWLMAARQHDRWETTQETTWALIALSDWMSVSGDLRPEYDWTLSFNQEERVSGAVNPQQALDSSRHTVDLEDILKANNALSIARGRGEGNLYYTAQLNTMLPVEEIEPAGKGYVVTRRYLNEDGKAIESGSVGETITVELTLIVRDEQYYVYVEDAFPAGAEGIDVALATESGTDRPAFSKENNSQYWGWWWFNQIQIRDEKATLYAERLPAGTYIFSYKLRLGIPGQYHVLPTIVRNFYFPDIYGRAGGEIFTIH